MLNHKMLNSKRFKLRDTLKEKSGQPWSATLSPKLEKSRKPSLPVGTDLVHGALAGGWNVGCKEGLNPTLNPKAGFRA